MNIEVKKIENSEEEINAVIDAVTFMAYWPKAVTKVKEMVEIDGFRKGNVPENMIVAKYGDMIILEEMANIALRDVYKEALSNHKVFPIGEPKVTIKKLAKDNPLELSIVVATIPEVTLPAYKTLAKEEKKSEDTTPSDEEVTKVLTELQKGRTNASSHDHAHDENGHHPDHDAVAIEEGEEGVEKKPEVELPPLDDDFAKSFGENFNTLEELKAKVKENLAYEKKQKLDEKNKQAIIERLIKDTQVAVPQVLIDNELSRMLVQMKGDITRFGGTWEEYLAHVKKTEDQIKIDWKDDAHKRVVSQLVLAKIAEIEKLIATEDEIEVELVRLLAQVQDADPERAKDYLRQALTNEKVFRFLLNEDK